MPGILCSIYDPTDSTIETKWQLGLRLVQHHPEHVLEQYSEPGFQLACLYHPEVCQAPRILVTERHILACYGNIYEDDLASVSDGEPLCRALLDRFLKRGADALQHLNGRYDIAVWDRRDRVLHFVSDRFGANRHYLLQRPGALHVACEVKALAVFLDRIEIDPAGLASMLSFGWHLGDLTLLRHVQCLPNARQLEYRAAEDRLSLESYWNYPYGELEPLPGSEAELAAQLHDHLLTALKRQLRGVQKILLPISGGLDSRTMAGLLAQSGFAGEVLAYSYGQASSRDVRYGRAIARKLGYRHVTIPTPKDFMTRHLEQAAWCFDAEWSAELNWGPRFSHLHPKLGDTHGYTVLSGMFGDLILGEGAYVGEYRRRSGDMPQPVARLQEVFFACNQEYTSLDEIHTLFQPQAAAEALERLHHMVSATLVPVKDLVPFYALNRSEFQHRQRRHTATVSQSPEYNLKIITPFLDCDVVDFSTHIPYELLSGKLLYKHMIRDHLPKVAAVPYGKTGLPLTNAPFRAAMQWRWQRMVAHFSKLARRAAQRNSNFEFKDGVAEQEIFFKAQGGALDILVPPLDKEKALGRYYRILEGSATPADQICAFLPPALFLHELKRRLAGVDAVTPHAP
jgi:asparagine synthetase B (glutamine-hydrolysing)